MSADPRPVPHSAAEAPRAAAGALPGWNSAALVAEAIALVGADSEAPRDLAWDQLHRALDAAGEALAGRYLPLRVEHVGGSGLLLHAVDMQLSSRPCAVKVALPGGASAADTVEREAAKLATLRHGNLVRVLGHVKGQDRDGRPIALHITDWIEGWSGQDYFSKAPFAIDEPQFLAMLGQVLDGLAYLHQHGIAHLDIKPANILISADDKTAYIADLGSAKYVNAADPGHTQLATTRLWADAQLVRRLEDPGTTGGGASSVRRADIRLHWDLAPLGKTLLFWLNKDPYTGNEVGNRILLSNYTQRYLLLMATRLVGIENVRSWQLEATGLTTRLLSEIGYETAEQAQQDLAKITGKFTLEQRVPELNELSQEAVQVNSGTPTTFTDRTKRLADHTAVRRLASVTQLGIVNQLYPTATHSRLEHSLGTFHNAGRLLRSLWHDPVSPLFRQLIDDQDATAILVTSLLHDIGQFPLAHDLEELDRRLFDHVRLTRRLLLQDSEDPVAEQPELDLFGAAQGLSAGRAGWTSLRALLAEWNTTPERVVQILDADPARSAAPYKDRILHSIIDGPLDADKLDYLVRDSRRLGLPYGNAVDVDRIMRTATVVIDESRLSRSVASIGVHEKGKVAAEFVSVARSAMFSQAYWHHSVRAMKAMLGRAVGRLIVEHRLDDRRRMTAYRSRFEDFVLGLPTTSYALAGALPPIESTLQSNDAAVILYLRQGIEGLPEAALLDGLLSRQFYRRLAVFPLQDGQDLELADRWEALDAAARMSAYEALEDIVLLRLDRAVVDSPVTEAFRDEPVERVRQLRAKRTPALLVDLPKARPGSDVPLYFVREASLRDLRKRPRAVGDVERSRVWQDFADNMRGQVGKLRIYAHPHLKEPLEAAMSRAEMADCLEAAIDVAER